MPTIGESYAEDNYPIATGSNSVWMVFRSFAVGILIELNYQYVLELVRFDLLVRIMLRAILCFIATTIIVYAHASKEKENPS